MATKSAGIPSDTASSASPRYLRTFDPCSISRSSRQSRIASAISVGVMSSSPAPSATALTNAIAFRTRSAAARAGIGSATRGLAWSDHHPAVRLLADARAADVGIVLQGEMNRAPFKGLHRIERDGVAGHLHLPCGAQRDLAHRVLAPLAVALNIDDDTLAFGQMLSHHDVGDRLQSTQGLAAPPDQRPQVAATDVERDRVGAGANGDLGSHAHVLEQTFDQRACNVRLAVGGRSGAQRRRGVIDDADFDDRFLDSIADDPNVHVPAALAKLDQSHVDGFVEGSATAFC